MNIFVKSITLVMALLLSGCYVNPWGVHYVGPRISYDPGYYNTYPYYNNGAPYRSGYQNNYPNRNWGMRERHYDHGDYPHFSGQFRQNGGSSRGRHW